MQFLLLLAVLPTAVLLFFIYKKDTYEKESPGLLISLFALGMASVIPAIIMELIGDGVLGLIFRGNANIVYQFIDAFFVVALSEELCKFVLAYIRTWKNKEFNYKFDGIVYTVFVSLGFATVENIMYVVQNGLGTAISRAILSVPGHAFFAVFMGYFYGLAKEQDALGNKKKSHQYILLALVSSIALHGFFDFCLFVGNIFFTIVYLMFVVAMDVFAMIRIHQSSKENHCIEPGMPCRNCGIRCNVNAFYCGSCGVPLRSRLDYWT